MHLERLISLLEIIAVAARPVSVAELHRTMGLSKPTCYRSIQSLLDQKLIDEPSQDSKFVIGERLIRIALLGKSGIDVRRCAAHLMRSAAIKLNETVFLERFFNRKVQIINIETPDDPARAYIHPYLGVRPMHACSRYKAIAAFAETAFQDQILSGSLKECTEHTKTTQAKLPCEFEQIAAQGVADCDQEIDIGIASAAAPVTIGNIGGNCSIGTVGPIRRFGTEYRMTIDKELKSLSKKVSVAIQLCNVAEV